jgi:hypothetical protein
LGARSPQPARVIPGHAGTPEIWEAVRSQVVGHGYTDSLAIAAELDVPHATVVRVLQRFAAVGALALGGSLSEVGPVEVVAGSVTARFRNLSAPLS